MNPHSHSPSAYILIARDYFSSAPAIDAETGDLTFVPAVDTVGSSSIDVILHDDGGTLNNGKDVYTDTFQITVEPVNDSPGLSIGPDPIVLEDSGPNSFSNWASDFSAGPADESNQTLSCSLTTGNPDLFSSMPEIDLDDGALTFNTTPDMSGSSIVTITLQDNGGKAHGGEDTYVNQLHNPGKSSQ